MVKLGLSRITLYHTNASHDLLDQAVIQALIGIEFFHRPRQFQQRRICPLGLSSADFCAWSGLGMTAYNSAFQELKDKGYLVLKDDSKQGKNHFVFYDKSMLAEQEEETIIEIPVEKVEQQNNIR